MYSAIKIVTYDLKIEKIFFIKNIFLKLFVFNRLNRLHKMTAKV